VKEKAMTPRIPLITAIVGVALVFAVPASADSWGADRNQAPARVSPDLADRAVAAKQAELRTMLDARERSLVAKQDATPAFADPVRDDRFRLDPSIIPTPVAAPGSGSDVEWPQIGIGFGVGVLVVIGLVLALRGPGRRLPAH
jgi:hypothetical protein